MAYYVISFSSIIEQLHETMEHFPTRISPHAARYGQMISIGFHYKQRGIEHDKNR